MNSHTFDLTGSLAADPARHRDVPLGVWKLADPKIVTASAVPFGVATALAIDANGGVDAGLAGLAFLAIAFVEVGKNAVNELVDYRSGADLAILESERTPFSGGKRVLVEGILSGRDVRVIALVSFAVAAIAGVVVTLRSAIELILFGAAAAAVSIAYSLGPFRLSYRGMGEAAVMVVYGPGIVIGATLLFAAPVTVEVVTASATLGLLIANVLLVNEIPDVRADRLAGKRTLVVQLGVDRAKTLIDGVFVTAFALPLIAAFYGGTPFRVAALTAGLPLAVLASDCLRRGGGGPPVAAQVLTIATFVASGVVYIGAVLL